MSLNTGGKPMTLNPNAAEFIPISLRTNRLEASISSVGKSVLDRSESSTSRHSDEESRQFWSHQLPDDITLDFKSMTEDDNSLGIGRLSLHGNDGADGRYAYADHHGSISSEKISNQASSFRQDPQRTSFMHLTPNPWDKKQFMNRDLQHGFMHDKSSESDVQAMDLLASQFSGFAAESLAEAYLANGCDLHLTIEMLTQLEMQVDGGVDQNLSSSKSLSTPNRGAQSTEKDNMFFSRLNSTDPRMGSENYASVARKSVSRDHDMWKYERNDLIDSSSGSSRSFHGLGGAFKSGRGRSIYADKSQNRSPNRSAPLWLEPGRNLVENIHSEFREEALDHTRLQNTYFDQAQRSYLYGNEEMGKEQSVKGQLHNMQMKAAHEKAQEVIYRPRNPIGAVNMRGDERMIELDGLHVADAIQVLKHELSILRATARAADQGLEVYISVGTGHQTHGSGSLARLPIIVQRFLLEQGLDFDEPHLGLLRVVIY